MVWWVDTDRYYSCSSKYFYNETGLDILSDRVFQTASIIYSLDSPNYDIYDINSLTRSGVNIFNIDLIVHSEEYFQKMKEMIIASKKLSDTFPTTYNRHVGLSITISAKNPIHIDNQVDVIIIKDVDNVEKLMKLKQIYNKNNSTPILLWLRSSNIGDMKPLIQFSDGVLVEVSMNYSIKEDMYVDVISSCKQACKSVFCLIGNGLVSVRDRPIMTIASNIIKFKFDGVMLLNSNNDNIIKRESIRSLTTAIDVIEKGNCNINIYKLCFEIPTPVLPPFASSLAASLAANQSGAAAIIVLTSSGASARMVANTNPPCPILAITPREVIARRLHLYRKVIPLVYGHNHAVKWHQECTKRVEFGISVALQTGLCPTGATLVVLSPSDENIGYCNSVTIVDIPFICVDDASVDDTRIDL